MPMNTNEIISGLSGAGATGAFFMFLIRRMIVGNDKRNDEQTQKIDKLTETMQKMQISLSVLNTKVENLTKAVDKINRHGCDFHNKTE